MPHPQNNRSGLPLNRDRLPVYKRARLPRKAGTWLRNCKGHAGQLMEEARALYLLQQNLAKILPEPLVSHVQVMRIDDDRISLAADSAVWASQLRYRRSAILRHMSQAARRPLQRLEIKISPLYAPPLVRTVRRCLSARAAQNLEFAAGSVNDPELAAALRRLARHTSDQAETDR